MTDLLQRFQAATAKIGAARLAQPGAQPARPSRARLIFALDATMSRQPTWDMACQLQGRMFDAAGGSAGSTCSYVISAEWYRPMPVPSCRMRAASRR
jgi:hypothetical protein